jgi:putative transcriptional regulator
MADEYDEIMSAIGGIMAGVPDEMPPLPAVVDVASIRARTGLSQPAFAKRVGVPVATLRNWEQGHRKPQGPARVLLALLDRNPRIVEETLGRRS